MNKDMGKTIAALRSAQGLSQQELADILGVSRALLSLVEAGERDLRTTQFIRLLDYFEVSMQELKSFETNVENNEENKAPAHKKRLQTLLLYILHKVGSKPNVGETVLYKLLYFVEKDFYIKDGKKLVGFTFLKRAYGPVPAGFQDLVEEMEKEGSITEVKSKYYDKIQKKYLPTRPFTEIVDSFTKEQQKRIDAVLGHYSDMSAKDISDISHKEKTWLQTPDNDTIDFALLKAQ